MHKWLGSWLICMCMEDWQIILIDANLCWLLQDRGWEESLLCLVSWSSFWFLLWLQYLVLSLSWLYEPEIPKVWQALTGLQRLPPTAPHRSLYDAKKPKQSSSTKNPCLEPSNTKNASSLYVYKVGYTDALVSQDRSASYLSEEIFALFIYIGQKVLYCESVRILHDGPSLFWMLHRRLW